MRPEDGIELRCNGDTMERVGRDKLGQVTFARFELIESVWKLNHVFTLPVAAVERGLEVVISLLARATDFSVEIAAERTRQAVRFARQEAGLPDGTGGAARQTWEDIARNSCDRAEREGRLTHAHIYEEESAEVLNATDPRKLRAELIQACAVAERWIADIDRRLAREADDERTENIIQFPVSTGAQSE